VFVILFQYHSALVLLKLGAFVNIPSILLL
jgi:hypothetical protein